MVDIGAQAGISLCMGKNPGREREKMRVKTIFSFFFQYFKNLILPRDQAIGILLSIGTKDAS